MVATSVRLVPALIVAVLLGSACRTMVGGRDVEPVARRYPHRYDGPCSSWLVSSKSGFEYCASPAIKVVTAAESAPVAAGPVFTSKASGPEDQAALMAHGETVYKSICATCHQPDGNGLAGTFPPLAGAGEYYGTPQNMARIVVHGLSGAITVKGQTYNGAMPPQGGALSDYDVAAVTTYVRNSFGNNDGIVLPADVAAVR